MLEDVVVNNIVMRDTTAAPLFIRLGDRRRAPKDAPMAVLHRVTVSDIDAYNVDSRYCAVISGVPGGIIEDIDLHGMRFIYPGGGTAAQAAINPPEEVGTYPDPDMFGPLPAFGMYLRHAKGVVLRDIEMSTLSADARPPVVTDDVIDLHAEGVLASAVPGSPLTPVQI